MKIIYLSWCIIALIWLLKYRNPTFRALLSSHLLLLGFIGLYYFLEHLFDTGVALYSGYFYEQIASYHRIFGRGTWPYLFSTWLLLLLTTLNLSRKIRRKTNYQFFLVGFIVLYLGLAIGLLGVEHFAYAISIIPGWYTTIVHLIGIETMPIILLLMIAVDFIFVRMGWGQRGRK